MLSRPASRAAFAAHRAASASLTNGARSFSSTPAQMATLKELEQRIKSVKNIEKITKSMKMIASTRLAKAQRAMNTAKAYGEANLQLYKEASADSADSSASSSEATETTSSTGEKKPLYIVVSSDRGLCGGIHSSVSKKTRKELADKDAYVVILGDKSKQQLQRAIPKKLLLTFNQLGREVPSFMDAVAIAEKIETAENVAYDKMYIVYNRFVSAIAYEAAVVPVHNADTLVKAPAFLAYELEDDDLIGDLVSFSLANAIYAALVEGHAAEISSRRNAMDNASKNAGEMIEKLQMQFNRGRQSAITNDLVDIITGANAL